MTAAVWRRLNTYARVPVCGLVATLVLYRRDASRPLDARAAAF